MEDGATVKIFYESRLAKVTLDDEQLKSLDALVDETTEASESESEEAKSKWSRLEALVGADARLDAIARTS